MGQLIRFALSQRLLMLIVVLLLAGPVIGHLLLSLLMPFPKSRPRK